MSDEIRRWTYGWRIERVRIMLLGGMNEIMWKRISGSRESNINVLLLCKNLNI